MTDIHIDLGDLTKSAVNPIAAAALTGVCHSLIQGGMTEEKAIMQTLKLFSHVWTALDRATDEVDRRTSSPGGGP